MWFHLNSCQSVKNVIDDLPGYLPLCTSCIVSDHAGLSDSSMIELFQSNSRLAVESLPLKLHGFS